MKTWRGTAVLGAAIVGMCGPAAAQAPGSATELEEITVTARKRDEKAKDVPISLTVIGKDSVPSFSADPGADLARSTPNFNFTDFAIPGLSYGQMRGVAPLGSPLNSLDSTIGYSVDGVPTSAFGSFSTLLDVERVEIARGPQGTLFGRNALGGAVHVISTPADGRREFTTSGEIGTDGHRVGEAIAGGWLVEDKVAGRVALRWSNVDGDIRNPIIGRREGDAEVATGKATLTFTPDDTLDVTVRGGFDRDHRNNPPYLLAEHPDFPVSGADVKQFGERDMGNVAVDVTKRFDAFSVRSISSFQHLKIRQLSDDTEYFLFSRFLPGTPVDLNDTKDDKSYQRETERVYSQELRLNSLEGAPVSWVAGASYFRSDYASFRDQISNFYATLNGVNDTKILSQTWAAFGDVSIPITDRITASGGLRLAYDDQTLDSRYIGNGRAPIIDPRAFPDFEQHRKFSDTYLTGRAALSYRWNDEVSTYASIAHGYTSGGFERFTTNATYREAAEAFRPSKGWTYEIGLKSSVLDDRVTFNAAAFFNDVKDGQLTYFDPATFYFGFENQDYRSYGFEAEASAKVTDRLTASGGFGFTKSKIVNVPAGSVTGAFEGGRVPNVPKVTANFGLSYVLPGSTVGVRGDFTATGQVQYVGSRQSDIGNTYKLDDYALVNAQLGWKDEKLKVYGFARNIFDKRPQFFGATFASNAHSLLIGRGRIVGAGASYSW